MTDKYRCFCITVDGTVFQTGCTFDGRVIAYADVTDRSGVDDSYVITDFSFCRGHLLGISFDQCLETLGQDRKWRYRAII